MIIVDRLLGERERAGQPLRVALIGAGFAAKGFALQLLAGTPGMRLAAISNRTLATAREACRECGVESPKIVRSVDAVQDAIAHDTCVVTDNPLLLCKAPRIDCIVEATGEIEFAARVAEAAFANGKHFVALN